MKNFYHNMIDNYNDFLNENMKKDLKKLLNHVKSYFNNYDDMEHLEKKLIAFLNNYKRKIMSGEIKKIDDAFIREISTEIDKETVESLNIDTFFRGINNILLKKKDKKIEEYFNDYIANIPKRLQTMYNAEKDIDITDVDTEDVYYDPYIEDSEFAEWRKVVSQAPKFRVKRRRFEMEKASLQIELLKMRDWLARNNKKVVILCEGKDSAGKGSFIRTATENLHPEYYRINTFGIPTEEDRKNWFWRYEKVLPKTQQIAFYDRSWYNRAVVEPVMKYCTQEEYEKFMKEVLPFEYKLIDEGYYLVKLWFSITKETQKLRFKLRQTSPVKYWKYSENDAKSIDKWEEYTTFKEEMFQKTSTEKSPWVVVDSNDKRIAKLNALRYILNQIPYDNKKEDILETYPEVIYPIL